jgi:hypothetical protein
VIAGGAGADIITGGVGIDVLTGGAGADVFVYSGTAQLISSNAIIDSVNGGDGSTDAIRLDGATTAGATDLFARITNVEQITAGATDGVLSITATASDNTFANTQFNTIDFSGDTNTTGTNVISLTGATGISTVTGGAGVEQVTLGAAATAATVTGGGGIDEIALGTGNNHVVAYATTADNAGNNTITGFTVGNDRLAFATAFVTGSAAGNLTAAEYMEVSAASNADAATEATNIATAINAIANRATASVIVLLDSDSGAQALDATSIAAGTLASDLVGSGYVLAIADDQALTAATLYYDADFNTAGGLTLVGTITLSANFGLGNISESNFLII